MQRKYKHKHTYKWHKDLCGEPPQRQEEKTTGVDQPVHANFTMSNLGTEFSLEPLEITTHFSSLSTGNNNNNHKWQDYI
jgi:hypothetical protein